MSSPNFTQMYADLKAGGYKIVSDYSGFNEYERSLSSSSKDFTEYIRIVSHWLPSLEHKVGGLLLLCATKRKYDGWIIIPVFESGTKNDRWRICDLMSRNPPENIQDWVRSIYLSSDYDYFETGLLPLVVEKMFDKDEARKLLREGFDLHPEVSPQVLGKIGQVDDIYFLENKRLKVYESKFIYKEIDKAIKRLKKKHKID